MFELSGGQRPARMTEVAAQIEAVVDNENGHHGVGYEEPDDGRPELCQPRALPNLAAACATLGPLKPHEPRTKMVEKPTLYVCHGDEAAPGCIRVVACKKRSGPQASSTTR